jgi:hypothetical protein
MRSMMKLIAVFTLVAARQPKGPQKRSRAERFGPECQGSEGA